MRVIGNGDMMGKGVGTEDEGQLLGGKGLFWQYRGKNSIGWLISLYLCFENKIGFYILK